MKNEVAVAQGSDGFGAEKAMGIGDHSDAEIASARHVDTKVSR